MAAHSLEVSRTEYLRLIAAHANWNRDPSVWSNDQETDGFDILKEALTQFYFPPILPGDRVPHEWRFLWIKDDLTIYAPYSTGTITVAANGAGCIVTLADGTWPSWAADGDLWFGGSRYPVLSRTSDSVIRLVDTAATAVAGTEYSLIKHEYALPDDYGAMNPQGFTYRRDQDHHGRITLIEEATMRALDRSDTSGVTRHAAIMPMTPNDDTESTRWYATFWPLPSDDYILDYVYYAAPPTLSDIGVSDHLYVYGGPAHAATVRASIEDCTFQKVHRSFERHDKFLEQLARSVRLDQRRGGTFTRGKGARSLAPSGPEYEQALYEHRTNSPNVHDNISFG